MSQIVLVLRYNICRDDNKGGEMMPKTEDASKIAELYSMYEQKMFYEARGILNDDQLAEDAVQEAFLKLIRHRDRLSTLRPEQISSYAWQTLRSYGYILRCIHPGSRGKYAFALWGNHPEAKRRATLLP